MADCNTFPTGLLARFGVWGSTTVASWALRPRIRAATKLILRLDVPTILALARTFITCSSLAFRRDRGIYALARTRPACGRPYSRSRTPAGGGCRYARQR